MFIEDYLDKIAYFTLIKLTPILTVVTVCRGNKLLNANVQNALRVLRAVANIVEIHTSVGLDPRNKFLGVRYYADTLYVLKSTYKYYATVSRATIYISLTEC